MIKLEDLIKELKPYGISDLKIIEQYFIRNHSEAEGMNMLYQLCGITIQRLYTHVYLMREYAMHLAFLLSNKYKCEKDKKGIFDLAQIFMVRDLTPKEFKEAKRIYDSTEMIACPPPFRGYLLKNKAEQKDKDALEIFLTIRNEI